MTIEARYLAGFYDGEGTCCVADNGQGLRHILIAVSNNYKPILETIKAQFGGCVSKQRANNWHWHTTNADAVFTFLTYVNPYLIIKQKEVAIALAILSTTNERGKRYTDQELVLRERLFDMLIEAGEQRRQPYS